MHRIVAELTLGRVVNSSPRCTQWPRPLRDAAHPRLSIGHPFTAAAVAHVRLKRLTSSVDAETWPLA
jgi:hypothetical protein